MTKQIWILRHPFLTAIIVFVTLVLLVNLLADDGVETASTSQIEKPVVTASLEDSSATTTPTTEPSEEMPDKTSEITVTRVIDGDTIEINTGERVRLICIDTPETGEDYYQEAKDYLTDLILNEKIELVKDKSETDRYDRLLRYIYFDGDFVNEMIVEEGLAVAYPYSPDTTLCPQITAAEKVAKSKGLGIWAEYEEEESSGSSEYVCSYNKYNCGDFSTHAEAQAVYDACGSSDVHQLDRDDDGLACETLP